MNKIYYTQPEIDELISELIKKIEANHHATWPPRFSVVVGIENGGVHISKKVADALELEHKTVKISHYRGDKFGPIPIVETNFFHCDLHNRGVLVVDDLVDSGYTIAAFEKYCGILGLEDAVAVLFKKPTSIYTPEFYVREETAWVVFPWEV